MDDIKFWKLIPDYLRYCKKFLIMLLVVLCIFSLMAYIFNLSYLMILYALALCCTVFLPVGINDFYKFYNAHKLLIALRKSIVLDTTNLPIPNNLILDDYQQLIKISYADKIKTLAKADETREDLINYYTMWVHQIKTPIAALHLLLQSNICGGEIYDDISNELTKIEQYVEMVLNYIKIGNDSESDFVFQCCNLDAVVKLAVKKYAKLFIRKKIALSYEPLNCNVLTDQKWLLFVIEQILSNSLKYTNHGKISIYMHDKTSKLLVIEDTGIGIESKDLPRIFDKGYTGYNGRAENKSTGIGLYLCKTILNRMGHKITADSQINKGTKITIDLGNCNFTVE